MKALSIQQPWAYLVVNGLKDIENRDWPTRYVGRIYVHTGKVVDKDGYAFVQRTFPAITLPPLNALPRGGIVGEVSLMGCVEESQSPWFYGRYGLVLKDGKPLPFCPCRGFLGFFEVPDELVAGAQGQPRLFE